MIWEYGNYEFDCNLQPPTLEKFKNWKKDFFKLKNVDKYNVWLTGGFIEKWKTKDVDILLTGVPNYKELKNILIDGITLGVTKYNMFVDLQHCNTEPSLFGKGKIQKIVCANKIVQDGRMVTDWTFAKEIYPNLYLFKKTYPTVKQMSRVYKNKPILIQEGFNNG